MGDLSRAPREAQRTPNRIFGFAGTAYSSARGKANSSFTVGISSRSSLNFTTIRDQKARSHPSRINSGRLHR